MDPLEFGGDMADVVTLESSTYKCVPYKFEAGTPLISEVIGLAEACKYLNKVGLDVISKKEHELKEMALNEITKNPGVIIFNKSCETGIITFNLDGVHPHDAASVFDKNQVCIRAGHHCAQPITSFLKQQSTIRASFYFYNDENDVKKFVDSVNEAVEFFGQF